MRKRWFSVLLTRRILVALTLVIQLCFIVYFLLSSSAYSQIISSILRVISLLVSLYILVKQEIGAYKLTWVFLILLFPVLGGLLYLLFHVQGSTKRLGARLSKFEAQAKPMFLLPGDSYSQAERDIPSSYISQIRYLQNFTGFPVYTNTRTKYLSPGEEKFKFLIDELKKAEKYIFLEYFIINDGVMWSSILDILRQKAKQGVDVRVMYDDVGCFLRLPTDYPRQLANEGIKCTVFNPFRPLLSTLHNNRDHRKIAVIDGKVAFTGGINLADEYINALDRFGHWKDASVMLCGAAAWSFTVMFLQMWSLCTDTYEDYAAFYPWAEEPCPFESDGYVQPYADSPIDKERVGEHVYMQFINSARDYLYINTPYLIIDDSMVSALKLAAKSGVDVRIVTPHRWDKRLVHMTTQSYYQDLIEAGVKVYEYSSGFMHSKTFVSDDVVATIGATNLDFRSLYLHFECGVWMYGSSAVSALKEDFLETLKLCQQVTPDDCKCSLFMRLLRSIFRVFAPLM